MKKFLVLAILASLILEAIDQRAGAMVVGGFFLAAWGIGKTGQKSPGARIAGWGAISVGILLMLMGLAKEML